MHPAERFFFRASRSWMLRIQIAAGSNTREPGCLAKHLLTFIAFSINYPRKDNSG
jgi:hypothetical protein